MNKPEIHKEYKDNFLQGLIIFFLFILILWGFSGKTKGAEIPPPLKDRIRVAQPIPVAPRPRAIFDLPSGTVLISRNRDERLNTSPGFWNHVCIYNGQGFVIESQKGIVEHGQGKGVIQTDLVDFLNRDYSQIEARLPPTPEVGERATAKAVDMKNKKLPFRQLSSLPRREGPRRQKRGVNCDSEVRDSYVSALGHPLPKWKIPDRIESAPELGAKVIIR